jgi:threonine aldolase
MRFFSDNAASVHPSVLEALARANHVDTAYDGDAISQSLNRAFSDLFQTDAVAFWIGTGTAANALALAALCPPYGSVLCHKDAHIQNDECGAPEFYTHGAKLSLIDGPSAKVTPEALSAQLAATPGGVHWAQPHALSITNATEYGCVYTPAEVAALSAICRARDLSLHMDGARFANAVAHLGCTPAAVTWQAGVDVLSFGFVKNGGLSSEALVFFKPELAAGFVERRKRAGHLLSKGRYSAAQILALLEGDVWLANARTANAGAQALGHAVGGRLIHPVEANEVFARMTPDEAAKLRAAGFDFYDWADGEVRFVVSWNQPATEIASFAAAIQSLCQCR